MKDIAVTLYEFLREKEPLAADTDFYGAEVLPSMNHPVGKGGKYSAVRVDNVNECIPSPKGNGEIQLFNAKLAVEIIVFPSSEKLEHLLEARNKATSIARTICGLFIEDNQLGSLDGAICDHEVEKLRNFSGNIQTKKCALSYIFLSVNNHFR